MTEFEKLKAAAEGIIILKIDQDQMGLVVAKAIRDEMKRTAVAAGIPAEAMEPGGPDIPMGIDMQSLSRGICTGIGGVLAEVMMPLPMQDRLEMLNAVQRDFAIAMVSVATFDPEGEG